MQKQAINCDSIMFNKSIISTESALDFLINTAPNAIKTELTNLDNSLNRILAEDIKSTINVPGFDNSAMDGYAITIDDDNLNKSRLSFNVVDRIIAGSVGEELKKGTAARIFTGAPIPKGANAVVMQEECNLSSDKSSITINRRIKINENIRLQGNDITKGSVIFKKGLRLKAQDISLVSSVGIDKLNVFAKITVGVFFTGNELVEPGKALKKGQIYNSNRYALVALLKEVACEIINLGNIKDDLKSTINAISSLTNKCDIIITTGGVSVGDEDYVRDAVKHLGELNLWKIRMKPGKPLAFGKIDNTFFIGLPGNPVSSFITFIIFALPFIRKMQGRNTLINKSFKVSANFDCKKPKPRIEYARVKIEYKDDIAFVNLYPKQGSDVMSSIVWADGIVEIPENTTFKKGYKLNYYCLEKLIK